MDEVKYLTERLVNQINWYDSKSISSQRNLKRLRSIEIIFAALIPFSSGIAANLEGISTLMFIVTGVLGLTVSIVASFIAIGKYQEKWIEYRTTCESLKKEKFLFLSKVIPYNSKDPFSILVQRTESLISKENTNWQKYITDDDEQKKD